MRELSFALEPWTLREQGFETALRAIADRFEADHRVAVTLDVGDADTLGTDDQVCLFQIVREAMTNALKHASPTAIDVTVHGSPATGLEARVADDGSGVLADPDDGLPHHGMASMRERAAILNGRLDVDAVPGRGTTVRVLVGGRQAAGGRMTDRTDVRASGWRGWWRPARPGSTWPACWPRPREAVSAALSRRHHGRLRAQRRRRRAGAGCRARAPTRCRRRDWSPAGGRPRAAAAGQRTPQPRLHRRRRRGRAGRAGAGPAGGRHRRTGGRGVTAVGERRRRRRHASTC